MRITPLLVGLLLVVAMGLVLPVVADDAGGSNENATAGDQVAAFVQTSEAELDGTIENETFVAALGNAGEGDERAAVVENRTQRLEERVGEIESEMEELRANREEVNPVAYRAQMSALASQLDQLNRGAEAVRPHAAEAGVDEQRLDDLQANASELAGPEVAEIARDVAGVEPPGPPEDRGATGNGTAPNGDDGPNAGDDAGEAANATDDPQRDGDVDSGDGTGANDDTDDADDADDATGSDVESDGSDDDASDRGDDSHAGDESQGGA